MPSLDEELFPSTPGKFKIDRSYHVNRTLHRCFASTSTMFLWALFLIALTASYLSFESFVDSGSKYFSASWGGIQWEKQVRTSAQIHRSNGMSVLVTGAAGFVGSHVSLALKKRGDGVVGIDNFNSYYDPSLKNARKALLHSHNIFIVEGDVNDARLLAKLFDLFAFTHVMHLAAQAGVRYAMENPQSYVHSNIAGLVTLLEACKSTNPQPAIVWASSSSVYGLNEKVPFSESDRTDQPASLYAATKKAGEEITHTYNHIYGLSITGLRFFTVYGPWGRPDMAYFSFTRNILQGKPITVYRGKNRVDLARDFTYIDDIVKGCVGSLDTAGRSTGSGGKKKGAAPYRIFNLGNTSPVTVPTLVSILERHLKMKAKKKIVDMPGNGDVPFTHANISLARRELGYKPTTDLQTGLRKFVRWYLSYYGYNHGKPTTKRAGWVKRGIQDPESIGDHMYRMGLMALISSDIPGVNRDKCIKMAIVHDIAEAIVGDITPSDGIPKLEKSRREQEALDHMCKLLGGGPRAKEIHDLWMEYEQNSSAEAKIVKDFDKVEMILQALEYENEQGKDLEEFFQSTAGKFQTDLGKAWASEIASRRRKQQ